MLLYTTFNTSQHCALTAKVANSALGCIRQSIDNRLSEVILPLCYLLVRPHVECWIQCWAAQYKRDINALERDQ